MLSRITFSREPAVWIALLGAVAVAVVQSGAFPSVTANAAGYTTLITLVVGIAIRFFVTPNGSVPAPVAAPAAGPAAPSTAKPPTP